MKNVVLLISNPRQATACGFIREYEALGGKLAGILCLQPQRDALHTLKAPLRFLKKLSPAALKRGFVNGMCRLYGMQKHSTLIARWNVNQENSWDLLKDAFDIQAWAQEKGIPFRFSPFLTAEAIRPWTEKGPTLFPMYIGGIIGDTLLKNANAEFLNAHMGDMPRYRGMNVIEWAVLEGQPARVTVMVMNAVIDGGDIVWKRDIPTEGCRTIADLRRTGYEHCYRAMAEGSFRYAQDSSLRQPQPSKGARYYYRMHGDIRRMLQERITQPA